MSKRKQMLVLCGVIVTVMLVFSFAGCAKKAVSSGPAAAVVDQEAVAGKAAAQSGVAATSTAALAAGKGKGEAADSGLITEYTVKKGESLWWIAKYRDIYDDAFLWPIIYKANKDKLKKPGRIYPGQKLKIPRTGFSMDDIKKARKKAGAKRPYMPPKDSRPPVS